MYRVDIVIYSTICLFVSLHANVTKCCTGGNCAV